MDNRPPLKAQIDALLQGLSPEERAFFDALEAETQQKTAQDLAHEAARREQETQAPPQTARPTPASRTEADDQEPTIRAKARAARTTLESSPEQTTAKHTAEMVAREARVQIARTQDIGQIAEAALVKLVDEGDAQAHTFQRAQMAALRDELAPPTSPITERLLAEAAVQARFEYAMWSLRSAEALLNPPTLPRMFNAGDTAQERVAKSRGMQQYKDRGLYAERAQQAQKRYLSALRDLDNLRRQNILLQVNQVHITSQTPPRQGLPGRRSTRGSMRNSTPALDPESVPTYAESLAEGLSSEERHPHQGASTWEATSAE